jgi:predicted RNase H-like nuclease
MEILFTGFDSAWGGRLTGAICHLAGEVTDGGLKLSVREPPMSVDWPEAVSQSRTWSAQSANHVVSIDQGLVVPNPTGMRPVERLLASALMGRFECGAHSSNYGNAACYGPTAGIWEFIESLEGQGYRHEPTAVTTSRPKGRFFFECYPHPALISLFNLNRTLPYKVSRRNIAGWRQLLGHLLSLESADLPIINVKSVVSDGLEWKKSNEDVLDSLIAAYVGAYLWWHGTDRSLVIGSLTEGYMVTPCNAETRSLLEASFSKYGVNPVGTAYSVRPPAVSVERLSPTLPRDVPDRGAVDLVVADHANLWSKHNSWMTRERCIGWRLHLDFVDLDEQPTLTFVPFDNPRDQGGMKPADDDTRLEWKYLAAGATSQETRVYRVHVRYEPL